MNRFDYVVIVVCMLKVGCNDLDYMLGFGNDFEMEVLLGFLLQGMNSFQKCVYGLYGEQFFGMVFIVLSYQNECIWCYCICLFVKYISWFKKIDLLFWKSVLNICDDVILLG